jgi:hypothetical protein
MGYPTSVPSFTTKTSLDVIQPSHVNDLQTEVAAIEGELITTGLTNTLIVKAGVKFPAAQATSADVNVLDDYEEGAFTPAISFGGGTTGITYSIQSGQYAKVGRNVWVKALITLSAKGSSTGAMLLTGLPFAEAEALDCSCAIGNAGNLSGLTGGLLAYVVGSSSTIALAQWGAAGSTQLTDAVFTNSTHFYVSGWYRAAN